MPCFAQLSPTTQIPVAASIATGAMTALTALLVPLDALADAISIGTLLAFCLVNAGVVVLRYTHRARPRRPVGLVCAFLVATFLGSLSFARDLPLACTILFNALGLVLLLALWRERQLAPPQSFRCPLVPWVPCAGIWINFYMLSGLQADAWIRVAVWLALGLLIYFAYGIRRSRLRRAGDAVGCDPTAAPAAERH